MNRKKRKAFVIAVNMLAVSFFLTGCRNHAEPKTNIMVVEESMNNPVENEEQETAETKNSVLADTEEMYAPVLAEYSDMIHNDYYNEILAQGDMEAYENCFGEHIGVEIRTHERNIYYAFYDIDKNGVEELLIAGSEIGEADSENSFHNFDLYTSDGEKVVHLFPEIDFGYRTNFSLYDNGIIEVRYSISAVEDLIEFYKISSDGIKPERIESFGQCGTSFTGDGECVAVSYTRNQTEVTQAEYNAGIQSYCVPVSLEWKQIL